MKDLNLPPFYVGQRVVCIKDHSQGVVKKGEEYKITSVFYRCCQWIITVGIASTKPICRCGLCGKNRIPQGAERDLGAMLFAPVETNFQAISYSKVVEKEIVSVN